VKGKRKGLATTITCFSSNGKLTNVMAGEVADGCKNRGEVNSGKVIIIFPLFY